MKWNLRLAAANRGIWKASELQRMLAEHGLVISTGKMSGLWSGIPSDGACPVQGAVNGRRNLGRIEISTRDGRTDQLGDWVFAQRSVQRIAPSGVATPGHTHPPPRNGPPASTPPDLPHPSGSWRFSRNSQLSDTHHYQFNCCELHCGTPHSIWSKSCLPRLTYRRSIAS
jgi:hypothetical protein